MNIMLRYLPCIFFLFSTLRVLAQKPLTSKDLASTSAINGFGYRIISADAEEDKRIVVYDSTFNSITVYKIIAGEFNQIQHQVLPASNFIFPSNLGDINGDGYDDLLLVKPNNESIVGLYGNANGFSTTVDFQVTNLTSIHTIDYSIDINNDGFDDMSVGQTYLDEQGMVAIFYGSVSGLPTQADDKIYLTEYNLDNVYVSVNGGGDVNGDGYEDLLVTSRYDYSYDDLFYFYCFYGSSVGPSTSNYYSLQHFTADIHWGQNAQSCGDVNGDGFDDIMYNRGGGSITVRFGGVNGITSANRSLSPYGDFQDFDELPTHVSSVGDIDNDGYDDIAFIKYEDQNYNSPLRVYIYFGYAELYTNFSGWKNKAYFSYETPSTGFSDISPLGDVNNDGYEDFLIGHASNQVFGKPNISLVYGSFLVYAELSSPTLYQCYEGNSFSFINESGYQDSTTILLEGLESELFEETTYSFQTFGWKNVVTTAFDTLGNFHYDTLTVFAQPRLASGTYTLGEGGYFTSISNLEDSLRCGLAGDVTIEVLDGYYDDHLDITEVVAPNENAKFILKGSSRNTTAIAGVKVENVSHVSVENISFLDSTRYTNPDSEFEEHVMIDRSHHVSFNKCNFHAFYDVGRGGSSLSKRYLVRAINSDSLSFTNNLFSSDLDTINQLDDGANPILYPLKLDTCNYNIVERNKVYLNKYDYGIYVYGNHTSFKHNSIKGYNLADDRNGNQSDVGLYSEGDNILIENNHISGVGYGLRLINVDSVIIINNEIGGNIGASEFGNSRNGIHVIRGNNVGIYHNTVKMGQEGFVGEKVAFRDISSFALKLEGGNDIDVKNNIFIADNENYRTGAISITNTTTMEAQYPTNLNSDYNIIQGYVRNTTPLPPPLSFPFYTDEFDDKYVELFGLETNSFRLTNKQEFETPFRLLPTNNVDSIQNQVPILPLVNKDINGAQRQGVLTDPGAYLIDGEATEFVYTSPYINAEVIEVITDTLVLEDNFITIKFTNSRPEPMDSVYLNYSVNGVHQSRVKWTGSIAFGDTVEYTFDQPYHVIDRRLYTLDAWVEIAEGYIDRRPLNDTLRKLFPINMDGTYSIMCDTCFYPTLEEANGDLKACGVLNHVTFEIPPGDYTSYGQLKTQSGPVTYTSSTRNSSDVLVLAEQYTTQFAHDIELSNLTIRPSYGTASSGFLNRGYTLYQTKNFTFNNCIFDSEVDRRFDEHTAAINIINSTSPTVTNCTFELFNTGVYYTGNSTFAFDHYGEHRITYNEFNQCKNAIQVFSEMDADTFIIAHNTIFDCNQAFITSELPDGGIISFLDFNNNYIETEETSFSVTGTGSISSSVIWSNTIKSNSGNSIYINQFRDVNIFNNYLTSGLEVNGRANRNNIGLKIFHNTILDQTRIGLEVKEAAIFNNIFYSKDRLCMINAMRIQGNLASDYNCFFSESNSCIIDMSVHFYDNDTDCFLTLDDMKDAYPEFEKNSIYIDPMIDYTSERATSIELTAQGKEIDSLYFFDKDSVRRNRYTPTIGAHVIINENYVDNDGDEYYNFLDCDDNNANIGEGQIWYEDADNDGVGGDATLQSCDQPTGYVATTGDKCPSDPNKLEQGWCGCGTPETDSDGDGWLDCGDVCPNNPEKTYDEGVCGCNYPVNPDKDNDGTLDCFDECPEDPLKTTPGKCGCGNIDQAVCYTPISNDIFLKDVKIYPNPSETSFYILVESPQRIISIKVTSVVGKTHYETTRIDEIMEIGDNWVQGTYLIHVQTAQGTYINKIVKL